MNKIEWGKLIFEGEPIKSKNNVIMTLFQVLRGKSSFLIQIPGKRILVKNCEQSNIDI